MFFDVKMLLSTLLIKLWIWNGAIMLPMKNPSCGKTYGWIIYRRLFSGTARCEWSVGYTVALGHVSLSVTQTHTDTVWWQQLVSDLLCVHERQVWRLILWQSSDDTSEPVTTVHTKRYYQMEQRKTICGRLDGKQLCFCVCWQRNTIYSVWSGAAEHVCSELIFLKISLHLKNTLVTKKEVTKKVKKKCNPVY